MLYPEWTALRRLMFAKAASGETLVEQTATGNPAVFSTTANKPLTGLTIPFTPIQAGSGDPSPENIRSISGITGLTISSSGSTTSNPTTYAVDWTTEAGTVYGGTLDAVTGVLTVEWEYFDLGDLVWDDASSASSTYCRNYIYQRAFSDRDSIPYLYQDQFEVLSINAFNRSVGVNAYFSSVNPAGRLYIMTPAISGMSGEQVKEFMTGKKAAVILDTPQTVQLDPVTVRTLVGTNTIWTDTNGTNTIKYLTKG